MIYFDNAATSFPKPSTVAEAVFNAINTLGSPSRGSHSLSLEASRVVYNTRERLAKLFNLSNPLNVAFTSNATESLNIVINGLFAPGDHIITTQMEHNSVLRPIYALQNKNIEVSFIRCYNNGELDYSQIQTEIRPNTKAIVCTHASNLTGNLIDINNIGSICKNNNLLFILDASQTAGVFDINMETQNIDILCFTGHKSLYGPQGTGGICIKNNIDIHPYKLGGSGSNSYSTSHPDTLPDRLEAGTINSHSIAGLLAGIDFLESTGIENIRKHELNLMWQFYNGIKNIKNVKIYGNFNCAIKAPIVSLNIGSYDSSSISDELCNTYNIATRAGAHCAPLIHKALGLETQGAVRFSFSYFNTPQEVNIAINAIKELVTLS